MIARLLYNRPLKTRILALCLLIATLSSGTVAIFSYVRASEIVRSNALAQANRTVAQAASYFDARFRNIQGQVYSLVASSTFKQVVERNGELSHSERVAAMSNLQAVLSGPRIRDSNIMSVYLYTPSSDYYELIFQPKGDFTKTLIYQEVQESGRQSRWLSLRDDEIFQTNRRVIPFVVPLDFSFGTGQSFARLSYLVVNVSEDHFREYLSDIDLPAGSTIYLATEHNVAAVSAGDDTIYSTLISSPVFLNKVERDGSFEEKTAKEHVAVNVATVEINGWKVVSIQPIAALTAGLADIQQFTVVVALFSLVVASVLSGWLSGSITRPMATLARLMHRIEERDFSVRFHSRYKDEVGNLGRAFNSMAQEIGDLIVKVEQEQRAKRQAELEALQAQINPHFLYNTLDSIYWKAMMGDSKPVAELALSLSTLFRLGLNGGREITTLAQEFEHVKNYLDIQKLCYGDKFNFALNYDPALSALPVVKLILQPLAENSIAHGFQHTTAEKPGQINISAQIRESHLCLEVVDSGSGFDPDILRKSLNEPAHSLDKSGHGYALKNVHARLQLHYGNGYSIELESVPYERTSIRLHFPISKVPDQNSLPTQQEHPINSIA